MKNFFIITLILLSILINAFSFNKVQDWGDDFAGYVIQAKTIHTGSYSDLKSDIKRNDFILNYPWGFPILISPLIKYFDSNIIIIKMYVYLFFLAALVVLFYLLRHDRETTLLTILFLASSPYFWEFKNYLLADIPNLFFVLLTLFVANRFLIKGRTVVNDYFTCFIIGALVFASYMIRNQSLVILPAIILVQTIKFRGRIFTLKKLLPVFIPVLVFLFFLMLQAAFIPIRSVAYLDQYANLQLGKTIWENIFYYTNILQELFTTTKVIGNVAPVFTGFFITFVFVGVFTGVKQHILFIAFFGMTMILVLISPFHQGVRYLIPVVPFLFYFFITGFRHVVSHISSKKKIQYAAYYSVMGIIIFLSMKTIFVYTRQSSKSQQEAEGPYKKTSIEMFDYIRNSTAENEIIGFCKPRAMLLYAGRNAVIPVSYEQCIKRNAGYLVYYIKAIGEQLPLDSVRTHHNNMQQVFTNQDFIVFKIERPHFE